jgi:hypothetical protein
MLARRCVSCSRRLTTSALESTDLLTAYKNAISRGAMLPDESQLRVV